MEKYELLIDCRSFNFWLEKYKKWKKLYQKDDKEINFLIEIIEEFLGMIETNSVIVSKYNTFNLEIYNGYINYLKNQIYKLLPLLEERGEWRKHLNTLIAEVSGADKIFLETINFITLLSKLEMLKEFGNIPSSITKEEIKKHPNFILFRKTIFESINLAESLTLMSD